MRRGCIRKAASAAVVTGAVMAAAYIGAWWMVPEGVPARMFVADLMCPKACPVYVSTYERRDGVEVRAHCRSRPGWW